jgi:hypothetical protein
MGLRYLLVSTLLILGGSLLAQGMSDDYLRARTEAKFAKPHGVSAEWDLFAHIPYFEQRQRSRANGLEPDTIGYSRDMDALPIGLFFTTELRVRFSWHDSIELGYGLHVMRAFSDELDSDIAFNGVRYPQGVDIDYGFDWHEFRAHYRRDLFRLGMTKSFTTYLTAGLEWAIIETQVGSDTFPVSDNRDRLRFKELLPWWSAGLGVQLELGDVRLTLDGRGTYAVGYPTFQKRDDNHMKQSVVSLAMFAALEYQVTDWFSLVARAKLRYLRAKLYGGYRADVFHYQSLGPEIGIGFRF